MNSLPDPVPFPKPIDWSKVEIRCQRCGFLPQIVYRTPMWIVVTDHSKFRCWLIRTAKKIGW